MIRVEIDLKTIKIFFYSNHAFLLLFYNMKMIGSYKHKHWKWLVDKTYILIEFYYSVSLFLEREKSYKSFLLIISTSVTQTTKDFNHTWATKFAYVTRKFCMPCGATMVGFNHRMQAMVWFIFMENIYIMFSPVEICFHQTTFSLFIISCRLSGSCLLFYALVLHHVFLRTSKNSITTFICTDRQNFVMIAGFVLLTITVIAML